MTTQPDPAAPPRPSPTAAPMQADFGLLAGALDHLPDQIFLMDRAFRFRYVNEAAVRALGYTRDELLRMSVFDVDPITTPELMEAHGREALETGRLEAPFESKQRTKDGRLLDVEISGGLLQGHGDDVLFIAVVRDIGERKRAEEQVTLLTRAIEEFSDAVYLMDGDFRFRYVNQAASDALGYSREELLDLDVLAIDPATTREDLDGLAAHTAVRGRFPAPVETQHRAKDGRVFPVEISGAAIEIGGQRWHLAIARDITERRRAEYELRLLSAAVNKSVEAALLMDTQFRFRYVNDTAVRRLGYSREELLAMDLGDIDPNFTKDMLARMRDEFIAAGSAPGPFETCHRAKDGRIFPVEIASTIIDDEGENFALVLVRDISERKRAEAAQADAYRELAVREQQFRTLAENSPDNIARYDREGHLIYANPRLLDELVAFGGVPDRIIGSKPGAITRWPLADEYRERIAAVIATGKPEHWEAIWQTPSGTRYHDIRIVPEREASGEIVGALTIGRDITQRAMMEQQLKESRAELRDLVIRREADREDERRRIAREIHDDLGQQLTALRFAVSLLDFKPGGEPREPREPVTGLLKMVDHTIRTVRDVSSWLRPAPIDMGLAPALQWLVGQFREHSDIRYEVALPDADLDLGKDAAINLFRIVQESLTNALRHSQARHVEIALRYEDGACVLEVRDDGVGFDQDDAPRSSWGLVGIRERAVAIGGDARITSSPGQGTTVRVRVPCSAG